MKMTVHQRLSAQRKAEHWKAVSERHWREVAWHPNNGGVRCHDCRDIPLTEREKATMSAEDWDLYRKDMAMYDRWDEDGPLAPEPEDDKRWHIMWALGYR